MFDFLEKLWSGNPNVPQIPYDLYLVGKIYFAGNVVSTMVYGTQSHAYVYLCSSCPFDPPFY